MDNVKWYELAGITIVIQKYIPTIILMIAMGISYFLGHYIGVLETTITIQKVQLEKQEQILKFKVSIQNTLEEGSPKSTKGKQQ